MSVPTITIIGNLAGDPELKQGNKGQWCRFTVITQNRRLNRESNQWEDGDRASFRCVAFGTIASNIGMTLHKGMRVIAQGSYRDRQWQDDQGQNRYSSELVVDEIGPALSRATAQVVRNERGTAAPNGGFSGAARNQPAPAQPAPTVMPSLGQDPWGAPVQNFGADGSEPEF